MTFSSLGLSPPLALAVAERGYLTPTPVQEAAIPAVLRGSDVWASARTGSGKTAAFVLPILDILAGRPGAAPRRVRSLVVVPTRELAVQIAGAIGAYGARLPRPLKTCLAVGGVSDNPQRMALRGGTDLLVATPGRLLDLVDTNAVDVSAIEILVLDEADRLLSLGFGDELARLLARVPSRRQTLLFSATFPADVQALAQGLLHEPARIAVDAVAPPSVAAITQRAIEVDVGKRTMLLRHLLQTHGWSHVLVFVKSRHGAEHVAMKLVRAGIKAAALHGELSQGARMQALDDFRARRVQVLVATDVAARGLDIVKLPAVVNYDLPRSPVDYLHRIGRTGRAGEEGTAVSFVTAEVDAHFRLIERRHRIALERETIAGFERTERAVPADPNGGIKGKGRSKKDKLREAGLLPLPSKSPSGLPPR